MIDYLIGAIVIIAVVSIILKGIKNLKKGQLASGCCDGSKGGCANCSHCSLLSDEEKSINGKMDK